MRIGELLLESELINAKQLAEAVHYMQAKTVPLGRCLKILRFLTDRDLERALEVQQLIRKGLEPAVAVEALRNAAKRGTTVEEALDRLRESGRDVELRKESGAHAAPRHEEGTDSQAQARVISPFELLELGDRLFSQERLEEAERAYQKARDLLTSTRGQEDMQTCTACVKLANLYLSTDRFEQAEALLSQVLALHRKVRANDTAALARALEDLGDLKHAAGDDDQAGKLFDEACLLVEQSAPIDVELTGRLFKKLAGVRANQPNEVRKRIGEFCTQAGLLSQDKVQQALERSKQTGKPIGTILRDERLLQADDIESLMLAQLLTKESVLPYAIAVRMLALSHRLGVPLKQLCESGRIVSEDSGYSQVYHQLVLEQDKLLTAESLLGANHLEVALIAERLADLYCEHNDLQSALIYYKRAQDVFERSAVEKSQLAGLYERQAHVLYLEGRTRDAEELLLQALELLQLDGESQSPDAARCLFDLAKCQLAMHNNESALSFLNNAVALYTSMDACECPQDIFDILAQMQQDSGQVDALENTLKTALRFAQEKYGNFRLETALQFEKLGDFYRQCGKTSEAAENYEHALRIYERMPGCQDRFASLDRKYALAAGK